ncbi:MAG: hypothetical protein PF689_05530 [Deltaproteobacteria bacterium]|jgi:hypothetical protein|nr:hypothetical protein [Deltaproteobacteria bacterium]
MFRFFLLFLIFAILSCNADPAKLGKKVRRTSYSQPKKSGKTKKPERNQLFGKLSNDSRLLVMAADLKLASKKKHRVGVIYLKDEQALRSLNLMQLINKISDIGCNTDWIMHVWTKSKQTKVEIMWKCHKIKIGDDIYQLEGTPRKVFSTLIIKTRLHPNHWLSFLEVPIVHSPKMVIETIKNFVEEIVPEDFAAKRFPSFTVVTEITSSLPKDLSKLDSKVKAIRTRINKRFKIFTKSVKQKGKNSIFRVMDPRPRKEYFGKFLRARWEMTVLCKLGTNSTMMYWYSNHSKIGFDSMNIPSKYTMIVVKKDDKNTPSLSSRLSTLSLDPPIKLKN